MILKNSDMSAFFLKVFDRVAFNISENRLTYIAKASKNVLWSIVMINTEISFIRLSILFFFFIKKNKVVIGFISFFCDVLAIGVFYLHYNCYIFHFSTLRCSKFVCAYLFILVVTRNFDYRYLSGWNSIALFMWIQNNLYWTWVF